MDDPGALALLPRAYSLALRLEAAGADRGLIADCLLIEVEAVEPLLIVAHQKLAAVRAKGAARSDVPSPTGGETPS